MRRNRQNRHTTLTKNDLKVISISMWMQKNGYSVLQYALAFIFIWYGLLKLTRTAPVDLLMGLLSNVVPMEILMPAFGVLELLIGLSMLKKSWIMFSLKLLIIYMPFTLLPFIFASEMCFVDFPFVLTLHGKAIISHLALISGAIVIAGRQHTTIIELKV